MNYRSLSLSEKKSCRKELIRLYRTSSYPTMQEEYLHRIELLNLLIEKNG